MNEDPVFDCRADAFYDVPASDGFLFLIILMLFFFISLSVAILSFFVYPIIYSLLWVDYGVNSSILD